MEDGKIARYWLFYVILYIKALQFNIGSINVEMNMPQKMDLVNNFNNEFYICKIQIHFSSYTIPALGLNLKKVCSHCVLFEAAIDANTEMPMATFVALVSEMCNKSIDYMSRTQKGYQETKMLQRMNGDIARWAGDTKMQKHATRPQNILVPEHVDRIRIVRARGLAKAKAKGPICCRM